MRSLDLDHFAAGAMNPRLVVHPPHHASMDPWYWWLLALVSGLAFASMASPAWADQAATNTPSSAQQGFWQRPTATGDWGGRRTQLDDQGISVGGSWAMEGFANVQGGAARSVVGASTLDANLTLDLKKLFGVTGGQFYIDLEDHAGRDPDEVVGDLQTIDKLNWTPYFQAFEFWYQQSFGDKLRIKIGKVDANSNLSIIDNGLDFLDASTQVTGTLLGFTTTPDPMPTVDIFYTPNSLFYAAFSAADSNQNQRFLDFYGKPWAIQPTRNGALMIGETGLTWSQIPDLAADGNLRLGLWGHTGTFPRFDGRTQSGAQGYYVVFNQTLWKPSADPREMRGVRTFIDYARTDGAVSPIDLSYGGGVAWTGPFATRPLDGTGVSAEYAHISAGAGLRYPYELLLEGFYNVQVNPWLVLKPDVQYVVHSGGRYPNALVGILQMLVTF